MACIDSEFIRHAKLTFNTETWRFPCKLIGPTPTHTHTHVHNNVRGTLWQFEIGLVHPSADAVADANANVNVNVSSCIGIMRDLKVSFNLLCGVSPVASRCKSKPKRKQTVQLLSRKWRRRSRRMHHAEPYYICRCSMWSCPSASTPLFPHCQLLSPLRRQCIHHLHGFFESKLFFSLSGNCDWWIDLLTRRQTNWIEQLTSWPFDRVTNWTDWQNADRLTPLWQSAVASLVQFRSTCPSVPSAFVRSISVKLYLMDFCAQTLQIIVTSSDSVEWGPPE